MRHPDDTKTGDLCAMDLAGPVPAAPTRQQQAAERAARYRARHGVTALTVNIDAEVLAAFGAKCFALGVSKNAAIEKLLTTQFLRKR